MMGKMPIKGPIQKFERKNINPEIKEYKIPPYFSVRSCNM